MPFGVSRRGRSVGELVTDVFGEDLTVAERRRAEIEIERANPHLRERGEVGRGAVVRIPDVPGLGRARVERDEGPPTASAVRELAQVLDARREELERAFEREAARSEDTLQLVDDDELHEAPEHAAEAAEELREVAEGLG